MRRIKIILWVVIVAALLLATAAQAGSSANYAIDWLVPMNAAGGRQAQSAHYASDLTVGQTIVGSTASPGYQLQAGFWVSNFIIWELHLPVMTK